jgi:hypothetical protein
MLATRRFPGRRLAATNLPPATNALLADVTLWIGRDASLPLAGPLDGAAISGERRSHEFPGSHQVIRSVGPAISTTRMNVLLFLRVFMLREVLSDVAREAGGGSEGQVAYAP